jgi:ATP synthase F1 complex assembly factor 2
VPISRKEEEQQERVTKTVNVGKIRTDGTTRRWYKEVTMEKSEAGWHILLDSKRIVTPKGALFALPNEQLALVVATEWASQNPTIKPAVYMPVMGLATTAIDNIPLTRLSTVKSLTDYLNVESILLTDEPESKSLAATKAALFPPIIEWFNKAFNVMLLTHSGRAIVTPDQPTETLDKITKYLLQLDDWHLAAVSDLAAVLHSTILALALYKNRISVPDAVNASTVEEDDQIRRCGLIEEAHVLPKLNTRVRVAAADVFLRLLPPNKPFVLTSASFQLHAKQTSQLDVHSLLESLKRDKNEH